MSTATCTPRHQNVRYMTTEAEYHSLKETYKFLCQLIDPKKVPNIPKSLRDNAKKCLKDYPVRSTLKELEDSVAFFNPR